MAKVNLSDEQRETLRGNGVSEAAIDQIIQKAADMMWPYDVDEVELTAWSDSPPSVGLSEPQSDTIIGSIEMSENGELSSMLMEGFMSEHAYDTPQKTDIQFTEEAQEAFVNEMIPATTLDKATQELDFIGRKYGLDSIDAFLAANGNNEVTLALSSGDMEVGAMVVTEDSCKLTEVPNLAARAEIEKDLKNNYINREMEDKTSGKTIEFEVPDFFKKEFEKMTAQAQKDVAKENRAEAKEAKAAERDARRQEKEELRQRIKDTKTEIEELKTQCKVEIQEAMKHGLDPNKSAQVQKTVEKIAEATENLEKEKALLHERYKPLAIDKISAGLSGAKLAVAHQFDRIKASIEHTIDQSKMTLGRIRDSFKDFNRNMREKGAVALQTESEKLYARVDSHVLNHYMRSAISNEKTANLIDRMTDGLRGMYLKGNELKEAVKDIGRIITGQERNHSPAELTEDQARLINGLTAFGNRFHQISRDAQKEFNDWKENALSDIAQTMDRREQVGLSESERLNELKERLEAKEIDLPKREPSAKSMEERHIKSREELDRVPSNYPGKIFIEFGTKGDPVRLDRAFQRPPVILDSYAYVKHPAIAIAGHGSHVSAQDTSVLANAGSHVIGYGSSQITNNGKSDIELYGSSEVTVLKDRYEKDPPEYCGSNIKGFDQSKIFAFGDKVQAYNSCEVQLNTEKLGRSDIELHDNAGLMGITPEGHEHNPFKVQAMTDGKERASIRFGKDYVIHAEMKEPGARDHKHSMFDTPVEERTGISTKSGDEGKAAPEKESALGNRDDR